MIPKSLTEDSARVRFSASDSMPFMQNLGRLTRLAHPGVNTPEMELSRLSPANEFPPQEFDVNALGNEVRYQRGLIADLIDLLEQRSGSLEFLAGLKALRLERDRIRQGAL
jgi:hypothetical protein